VLSVQGVSKSYSGLQPSPGVPARTVLRDVSLRVAGGEYVAIMGESGSGKSTLLNLIAGLDRPDAGRIELSGVELSSLADREATLLRRRRVGFVFQAFHLLPYLDVAANVSLPLLLNRFPEAEIEPRTAAMLAAVGLGGQGARYPRELSGGEAQRVAIARALVHEPALVLADEPTGNLDAEAAAQVLALLRERVKAQGAAGILVTHSLAAARTADRIEALSPAGLRPLQTRAR
jgi:putative ABC transport system ATP-binding protein